jgi:hypothetical protein
MKSQLLKRTLAESDEKMKRFLLIKWQLIKQRKAEFQEQATKKML